MPSNAKKAELVAAFSEHIAPIAPQLRQKYAADVAQPNGEGIVRASVKTSKKKSKQAALPEVASDDATSIKLPETHAAPDEALVPEATSPIVAPASPFSKENIFQSPPRSSSSILPSKRSKSPILPANDRLKLTKLSPRALTPRGKLFDEDDDDGEKDDLFSSNMIVKTPIKIRKRETSKKSKDKTHKALQRLIKADTAKLKSDAAPEVENFKSKPTEGRDILASTDASASAEVRQPQAVDDVQKSQFPSSPQVLNAPAAQMDSDAPAAQPVPDAPAAQPVPDAPAAQPVPDAPAAHGKVPAFSSLQGDLTGLAKELGVEIQGAQKLVTPIESSVSQKLTPKSTPRRQITPGNKKRFNDTQVPQSIPKAKADDSPKVARSSSKKKVSRLPETISISEKLSAQRHVSDSVNAINLLEHNIKDALSDGKEYVTSRRTKPLAIAFFGMLWLVLFSAGMFGWWYREQTFLVGYCGQEIHQDTIPYNPSSPPPTWLVKFGQYLDSYKPSCVPCPPHGRCFPLLELSCYNDFVDDQPWWFNFVPYPVELKQCIPDTKKAEKLEIMIDVAMDLLRARNANTNCGRNAVDDLSSGLSVQELHDMLLQMKAPYITTEEFNDLWQRSLVEMEKEFEIIVRHVGHNNLAGSMGLQEIPHPDPPVDTILDLNILTLRLDTPMITYLPPLTLTTKQKRKPRTKFFAQRPYPTSA